MSLESAQSQLALLLPTDPAEAQRLLDQARSVGRGPREAAAAPPCRGRAEGRIHEIENYAQWCECADTPQDRAFLRRLNDERNAPMADRVDAMHRDGKRVLVAVGALHMTGDQGLPRLMAARATRWSAWCHHREAPEVVTPTGITATMPAHTPPPLQEISWPTPPAFTKLVPGFDFLQGLVKNAGSALPDIGQWVAPTLNPEELEKRIEELRTVQFWLEQNARMLGATIQALEVQRMTLSTLKTMNVQMADLRESMKIRTPVPAPAPQLPRGAHAPPPPRRQRRTPAGRSTRCNGGAR